MPHRYIFSIKKASAVLKTEPILFKLRMLSKIMMSGVFSEPLKLWASILPSSLFFNFLFFMLQKYFFYARLSLKEILLGL